MALVLRGVPGIYLPSVFGSKNDVEAVYRDGSRRSINRTAVQERRLLEAFARPSSIPARIARRYVELLEARVAEPAFHPAAAQEVLSLDERVFALLREATDGSSRVLSLINVSAEVVPVAVDLGPLGFEGAVRDLVADSALPLAEGRLEIDLQPFQVVWVR